MAEEEGQPTRLVERWEALRAGIQVAALFPTSALILFAVNLGPFHQPLWRSVLYGLIEALPVTALVVVGTANEKAKRARR